MLPCGCEISTKDAPYIWRKKYGYAMELQLVYKALKIEVMISKKFEGLKVDERMRSPSNESFFDYMVEYTQELVPQELILKAIVNALKGSTFYAKDWLGRCRKCQNWLYGDQEPPTSWLTVEKCKTEHICYVSCSKFMMNPSKVMNPHL
jgi:hypothetical protein